MASYNKVSLLEVTISPMIISQVSIIGDAWAVVVVKWSAWSPSIPKIWFTIPTEVYSFILSIVWMNKNKQKVAVDGPY